MLHISARVVEACGGVHDLNQSSQALCIAWMRLAGAGWCWSVCIPE